MKWKVFKVTKEVITSTKPEELWTPANIVTLVRICAIPVFVIALISPWPTWLPELADFAIWKEWIAAVIFILLAATDALDGYLARSRGQITNFGKFMDPLADKILVAAALLALIELGVLPSWVALIILTREFIVSGIRMVAASQGVVIAASWYGKAKTVSQIVALVLFIVKDNTALASFSDVLNSRLYLISWAVMVLALVLTILSMLDYFSKAKHLLGFDGTKSRRKKKQQSSAREPLGNSNVKFNTNNNPVSDAFADVEVSLKMLEEQSATLINSLRSTSHTIGSAESCTGGMISTLLTSIAGSSDVVNGAIISYSNEVKINELGVLAETLDTYGAVSEQTALQMVRGAREALNVDIALSTTGIAGPTGASPGKPLGTVWIAASDGTNELSHCFLFKGNRADVRTKATFQALKMAEKLVHETSK